MQILRIVVSSCKASSRRLLAKQQDTDEQMLRTRHERQQQEPEAITVRAAGEENVWGGATCLHPYI